MMNTDRFVRYPDDTIGMILRTKIFGRIDVYTSHTKNSISAICRIMPQKYFRGIFHDCFHIRHTINKMQIGVHIQYFFVQGKTGNGTYAKARVY